MQKVKLKPKKKGRVGQFLRKFAEIVIAGGPYYIQPLWNVGFGSFLKKKLPRACNAARFMDLFVVVFGRLL